MRLAKNLNELKELIKDDTYVSLANDVFPVVQSRMIKHIALDVYEEYEPRAYVRRYINSGLSTRYIDFKFDNTKNKGLLSAENIKYYFADKNKNSVEIFVYNDTLGSRYFYAYREVTIKDKYGHSRTVKRRYRYRSQNAGLPIANVIETGEGYDIGLTLEHAEMGQERPFMQNTYEDLARTEDYSKAFVKSMRAKGYDIK